MTMSPNDRSKLAKNGQEYRDLVSSEADWIVRSADQLTQLRDSGEEPLTKVPDEDFRAFVESLKFNGVALRGDTTSP